jgi:Family of unknown function (DUF5317)
VNEVNRIWKHAIWAASSVEATVAGAVLNLLTVFANDGMMPVFIGKLCNSAYVLDSKHHICMTAASNLKILCDYIPVPGMDIIMSPGDVLLFGGFSSICVCFVSVFVAALKKYW